MLSPGMSLELRLRDGRIEIEPEPLKVTLEGRGRLTVAVPQTDVPVLTTEIVEETRRLLRRRPMSAEDGFVPARHQLQDRGSVLLA